MKNRRSLILFAAFILISTIDIGSAWTVTRITTNASDQFNPDIYSNYIVWQDVRNGGSDIYLQNMATKVQTRVTKGVQAESPAVSSSKIVWQDHRNGNWDIYMYEISTKKTTRITLNTADQTHPDTYGNYIVWQDTRNGKDEVFLQDLVTKKQTIIGTGGWPSIYGTKIAYSNGEDNINVYDITTKKTTTVHYGGPCSISGTRILIADMFNAPVMYLYDFATKKTTNLPLRYEWLDQPRHYSSKIVYVDYASGSSNSDIYMLTL